MIYVDEPMAWGQLNPRAPRCFRTGKSCHMFSDLPGEAGTAELLAMAKRIGLKPQWIQHAGDAFEHFDLTESRRAAAVKAVATQCGWRESARISRAKVAAKGGSMKTIDQIIEDSDRALDYKISGSTEGQRRLVRAAIAACAEEVRAAGCVCGALCTADQQDEGCGCGAVWGPEDIPLQDDPRCPRAIAARLEGAAGVAPVEPEPTTGVSLIAAERGRQIADEGWSSEHDNAHNLGDLARAGAAYALAAVHPMEPWVKPSIWPWDLGSWKPRSPLHNLVRAGALIAAEIDRRLRAGASPDPRDWPNGVPTDPRAYFELHPPTEAEIAHGQALEGSDQ